eukprot:Rmarinus@m.23427
MIDETAGPASMEKPKRPPRVPRVPRVVVTSSWTLRAHLCTHTHKHALSRRRPEHNCHRHTHSHHPHSHSHTCHKHSPPSNQPAPSQAKSNHTLKTRPPPSPPSEAPLISTNTWRKFQRTLVDRSLRQLR